MAKYVIVISVLLKVTTCKCMSEIQPQVTRCQTYIVWHQDHKIDKKTSEVPKQIMHGRYGNFPNHYQHATESYNLWYMPGRFTGVKATRVTK